MKRKNLLIISLVSLSAVATACSTASAPAETNGNANVPVVQNEVNPIANNTAPPASPAAAANSAVPGIPNAPANINISKDDPTRSGKIQTATNPAPDNSEITYSLGDFPVETRIFKNNAQIAKVERIQDVANKKTTVKVYLKNGQVKELTGDIGIDPMRAMATEIMYKVQNAPAAKPEPRTENPPPSPAPQTEKRLEKRGAPQKNQ